MLSVEKNLEKVYQQVTEISRQCDRSSPPSILAVSKFHPVCSILDAYRHGQKKFGENYVQELIEKSNSLMNEAPAIQWHFIGHLQTNKCKGLLKVRNLKRVSTVDSINLANKLEAVCLEADRVIEVLAQVAVSDEETKSGVPIGQVSQLIDHIIVSCPHLHFEGLMTLGHTTDEAKTVECFNTLSILRDRLVRQEWPEKYQVASASSSSLSSSSSERLTTQRMKQRSPHYLPTEFQLSMGMSSDISQAIAAGSTEVRVGTAIFGARPLRPTDAGI